MAETETGWTKTRPGADGDYFSRIDEHDKSPVPIRIADEGAVYEFGQGGDLRREYAAEDYEYLGPFTAADFEQLTRLREAAEKALRLIGKGRGHIGWCRHRHQQINDRDSNASLDEWLKDRTQVEDALREALAQRNTGGK